MSQPTLISRPDGYTISIDKKHLNQELIYQFLRNESYWAQGMTLELVQASIENSAVCYGVYKGNPETDEDVFQVGFARVVSDFCRFSWVGDVFILTEHRGKGLSKWLMETITDHPFLKGTSFHLGTRDAHELYKKFGFEPIKEPQNRMSRPLNWELIYEAYNSK